MADSVALMLMLVLLADTAHAAAERCSRLFRFPREVSPRRDTPQSYWLAATRCCSSPLNSSSLVVNPNSESNQISRVLTRRYNE